jgi:hypothetical protein
MAGEMIRTVGLLRLRRAYLAWRAWRPDVAPESRTPIPKAIHSMRTGCSRNRTRQSNGQPDLRPEDLLNVRDDRPGKERPRMVESQTCQNSRSYLFRCISVAAQRRRTRRAKTKPAATCGGQGLRRMVDQRLLPVGPGRPRIPAEVVRRAAQFLAGSARHRPAGGPRGRKFGLHVG